MDDSKPRIAPLPRNEWTDAAREVFAFWGEPNAWEEGSATNSIMTYANHPTLATAYNIFGKHILITTELPGRPRELSVLRVAWRIKSDYEWHYHVGYATTLGITPAEILACKTGPDAPNWNEEDAAVLRATDELMDHGRIQDPTWETLARYLNRRQMMDFVYTVGSYLMTGWALSSFGVQLEDGVDKIDYDLNTASGRGLRATYRPGEVEDWVDKRGME